MDKLQNECGVTVHRTTVGKNIKQLADCGFDIYTHKTTQNRYYAASRLFEMPELKAACGRGGICWIHHRKEKRGVD